jgi:hypothetical protein
MSRCPTCGQPMLVGDRAPELLRLLAVPCSSDARYVYRLDKSDMWAITHRGTLPPHASFSHADVMRAVRSGALAPVYPGTEAEREAFGLASYFGRENYKARLREKVDALERRRLARSKRAATA